MLDKLVEALDEKKFLGHLKTIQKVKQGVMYAIASDNPRVLQSLAVEGLEVDGIHLEFKYHKINTVRVYVANIPFGVSARDIQSTFSAFGTITEAHQIQKDFRGHKLYTGDWSITFQKLDKEIPSYVLVRRWLAYVNYQGQKKTCRLCEQSGHFYADCLKRKNQDTKSEETSKNDNDNRNPEPENMDTHEMPPPNEPDPTEEEMKSTPTMQEENPESYKPLPDDPAFSVAYQEILENLETKAKDELSHVTVEHCQILSTVETEDQQSGETLKNLSQAWADSKEESCTGSVKPQEMSKTTGDQGQN